MIRSTGMEAGCRSQPAVIAPGFELALRRRVESVENEQRGVTVGEIASRRVPGWVAAVVAF
jgi:hypothetical protein